MFIHTLTRRILKFVREKHPRLRTLEIRITGETDQFIASPEFENYFNNIEPNEEVAYLKGYVEGKKANGNLSTLPEHASECSGTGRQETRDAT